MRTLLVGIDSGTQSTKVLVVDAKNGKVLAAASQGYELMANLPPGVQEQHPHTWRDATASAIRQGLRAAKAIERRQRPTCTSLFQANQSTHASAGTSNTRDRGWVNWNLIA